MPIPDEHIQERLSVAYVSAISARAGFAFCPFSGSDYGTDGFIQRIKHFRNGKFRAAGAGILVQIKATSRSTMRGDQLVYPMDAIAYNKLAEAYEADDEDMPMILLLYRMPKNNLHWLEATESQLLMRECCYWKHITEKPTDNSSGITIEIPKSQKFTVETVLPLFEHFRRGKRPSG